MSLQAYLGQSVALPTHAHSPALNHSTSTFLSYALHFEHAVPSRARAEKVIRDLKPVVSRLKMDNFGAFEASNRMRDPDHVMWAFRSLKTKPGKDGTGGEDDYELVEEFEDDDEKWGGERLLRVLREQGGVDIMLVCIRWYGGDMIGPARFQHIHTTATTALAALQEILTLQPLRTALKDLEARIQALRDALAFAKSNGNALPSPPLASLTGSMKKPAPNYDNEKDIGKLERLVKAKTRAVEDLEKKVAWEESLAVGEMGLMATSQEIDLDVANGSTINVESSVVLKLPAKPVRAVSPVVIDLTIAEASASAQPIASSSKLIDDALPLGGKRSAPDSNVDLNPRIKKPSPPSVLRADAPIFTPVSQASSSQASSSSKPAVHSFFAPKPPSSLGPPTVGVLPSPPTLVHYVHMDPFANVQTAATSNRVRVIFFDMDGTLIKPRLGGRFPKSETDWMWLYPEVPKRIAEEVKDGRHVVVLSNQGSGRPKLIAEWKKKLRLICESLPAETPMRILGALSNKQALDKYRKPATGMFDFVKALYEEKGYAIDMDSACYVGDAAGRVTPAGRLADHSNCDLKMARNAGIRFMLPEEYFLGKTNVAYPDPPLGFRPAQLHIPDDLPMVVPSHLPVVGPDTKEIVVFVGLPASGKTTLFRNHFQQHGYEHINQDQLRSRDRCLRQVETVMSAKGTRGCVVDNTNRDRKTRKLYVELANKLNVPIRCFYFTCPEELARHNNAYRAFYGPPDEEARSILPGSAFSTFSMSFEMPELSEGFSEIRYVNFVFQGNAEQRRRWEGWMS